MQKSIHGPNTIHVVTRMKCIKGTQKYKPGVTNHQIIKKKCVIGVETLKILFYCYTAVGNTDTPDVFHISSTETQIFRRERPNFNLKACQ